MTVSLALRDLRESTSRLSEAVTELMMIAHEDRPHGSEVAAVDDFAEQVSELQASVVTVGRELAGIDGPAALSVRMPAVDAAIAAATLHYWRDLRSYDATAEMRLAARRGGIDWRSWQVSIEQSQQRCEQPLLDTLAGARTLWLELADLVALWLAHPPPDRLHRDPLTNAPTNPPTNPPTNLPTNTDAGVPAAENTRRSS